jgi:hypothetical protein
MNKETRAKWKVVIEALDTSDLIEVKKMINKEIGE